MTGAESAWLPARYAPLRRLGAGGMGEVWLAEDRERGGKVAVKRLRIGGGAGQDDRLRFKREFLVLSNLRVPGVVTVHDFHESDSDLLYTMDAVEGWPLHDYLRGGRWRAGSGGPDFNHDPAGLAMLWKLADELFAILAGLHAESLIHRDLKPSNLLVDGSGKLHLIDFGLARATEERFDITRAGEVMGTPQYLAPEQVRAQPLDGRADLYAAGVLLYELATGTLPFKAGSVAELLVAHLQQAPPGPRERNPALSPDHGAFLLRLLAKQPAGRFPTAADARRALSMCAVDDPGAVQHEPTRALGPVTADEALAGGLLVAPYTGNQAALARMGDALRAFAGGRGGALLVGGTAGAGKSRLADECRGLCAELGLRAFTGIARQEAGLPAQLYQGVMEQIASLLASRGETPELPEADRALLARWFPAFQRFAPPRAPDAPLDGPAERTALLGALYGLFRGLARNRRPVLILEDIHWADPLSLELTTHLCASFSHPDAESPILIAANHRDDSASMAGGLGDWLRRNEASFVRLSLSPLDPALTGELIRGLMGLDAPPPPEFLARIHALTGGNPYFIRETLQALIGEGTLHKARSFTESLAGGWNFMDCLTDSVGSRATSGALPESVQSALRRQLDDVEEEARQALQAAALIGREFRFDWWLSASGRDEDRLVEIADMAIRRGLLTELGGESLRFAHDQLRATLAGELSNLRRRRLHAKILARIEEDPAASEELRTEQAIEAGDAAAALRHGLPVLERLHDLYQTEAAERLLARLDILAGPVTARDEETRLNLEVQRIRLMSLSGSAARTSELIREALPLAGKPGRESAEFKLWSQLALTLNGIGDTEGSLEAGRRARAIGDRLGDPSLTAMALIRQAATLTTASRFGEALEAADEADRVIAGGDLAVCEARIAEVRGKVEFYRQHLASALEQFDRVRELAARSGDRMLQVRALGNLAAIHGMVGNLRESESQFRLAYEAEKAIGDWRGLANVGYNLGYLLLLKDDIPDALRLMRDSLEIRRRLGEVERQGECLLQIARAHLAGGDDDSAERCLNEAERLFRNRDGKVTRPDLFLERAYRCIFLRRWDAALEEVRLARGLIECQQLPEENGVADLYEGFILDLLGKRHTPAVYDAARKIGRERKLAQLELESGYFSATSLLSAARPGDAKREFLDSAAQAEARDYLLLARLCREAAASIG